MQQDQTNPSSLSPKWCNTTFCDPIIGFFLEKKPYIEPIYFLIYKN